MHLAQPTTSGELGQGWYLTPGSEWPSLSAQCYFLNLSRYSWEDPKDFGL